MRTTAQNATLALLLEVCGTPKPGNVDRRRDLPDLWFEHFLAGAVGAQPGLRLAANGAAVGPAFERAVEGMATQRGGNTQFGALLLLVPLVRAARTDLAQPVLESILAATTVADAAAFYRAFDHVDVFVEEPPEDLEALDVRRGSEAVSTLEERGLTLADVMAASVPGDGVAHEWVTGFERSFEAAERLTEYDAESPLSDRIARLFLTLLADEPDTLIAKRHGEAVANRVTERARDLLERENETETAVTAEQYQRLADDLEAFADDLVARGINPGTTADITAAGVFIALERRAVRV